MAIGGADPGFGGVAGGLLLVGGLNLVLGLVSLLPGLPLDGGRVVRALAWARSGDRDIAARFTARVGRLLGWTTVGIGVAMALVDHATEGLIVLCLGWLLATGARTLDRRLELEALLKGTTVGEAMRTDGPRVGPHLTVDTFADRFQGPEAVSALAVVEDERVLGVIGGRRLQRLGRRRYGATRAADVLAAPPLAPLLAPGDQLWVAVEHLNAGGPRRPRRRPGWDARGHGDARVGRRRHRRARLAARRGAEAVTGHAAGGTGSRPAPA